MLPADPAVVIDGLVKQTRVDKKWLDVYNIRKMERKEDSPAAKILTITARVAT